MIGLPAAFALTRLVTSIAGSVAVLLAAAIIASLLPALRAARVDVMQALRSE